MPGEGREPRFPRPSREAEQEGSRGEQAGEQERAGGEERGRLRQQEERSACTVARAAAATTALAARDLPRGRRERADRRSTPVAASTMTASDTRNPPRIPRRATSARCGAAAPGVRTASCHAVRSPARIGPVERDAEGNAEAPPASAMIAPSAATSARIRARVQPSAASVARSPARWSTDSSDSSAVSARAAATRKNAEPEEQLAEVDPVAGRRRAHRRAPRRMTGRENGAGAGSQWERRDRSLRRNDGSVEPHGRQAAEPVRPQPLGRGERHESPRAPAPGIPVRLVARVRCARGRAVRRGPSRGSSPRPRSPGKDGIRSRSPGSMGTTDRTRNEAVRSSSAPPAPGTRYARSTVSPVRAPSSRCRPSVQHAPRRRARSAGTRGADADDTNEYQMERLPRLIRSTKYVSTPWPPAASAACSTAGSMNTRSDASSHPARRRRAARARRPRCGRRPAVHGLDVIAAAAPEAARGGRCSTCPACRSVSASVSRATNALRGCDPPMRRLKLPRSCVRHDPGHGEPQGRGAVGARRERRLDGHGARRAACAAAPRRPGCTASRRASSSFRSTSSGPGTAGAAPVGDERAEVGRDARAPARTERGSRRPVRSPYR